MSTLPTVVQATTAAIRDIRPTGKDGVNSKQGFKFRSIEALMDASSAALAAHGVMTVPTVLSRAQEDRMTYKGEAFPVLILQIRYDIYGPGGDMISAIVHGESSMVGDDKATGKASTNAFKIFLNQVLKVPFSELVDPDETNNVPEEPAAQRPQAPAPEVRHPDKASDKQLAMISAQLKTLGYMNKDDIFAELTTVTKRPITSRSDLTRAEAHTVIEHFKAAEAAIAATENAEQGAA